MNTPTNWRQQLTDLGGYENEMLGVPAGGVRKMVDEIERLRAKLAEITSEQLETRRKHREDYEALHDAVAERNELRAKLAALEEYGSMLSPDQLTLLELLKAVEWSDHHYDPAHSHSFSCPICGGASREGDLRNIQQDFGHREGCAMNHHIKALAVKQALHDGTTEGRRAAAREARVLVAAEMGKAKL